MNEKDYSPKRTLIKILLFGLLFAALHILLERTLSYTSTDISLTHLLRWLNLATTLCDAASLFVCYALLSTLLIRFSFRETLPSVLLATLLIPVKHLGNAAAYFITDNVTLANDIKAAYIAVLSAVALEVFQMGAVVFLFLLCQKKQSPAKSYLLSACAVMVIINILSRLLGDIDYGAPTSAAEGWVMIAYYAADIVLYGVLGFFAMLGIAEREIKKN